MTLQDIKTAVENGKTVHWANSLYTVVKDQLGQWLIVCDNGHAIGLTWADGETLNGAPIDFYVAAT